MKKIIIAVALVIGCGSQGTSDVGDQGPAGPQGLAGIQGPKGDNGAQGIQGPAGIQGLQGDRGSAGPQGAQGTQGLQGIQGPVGPQGVQGIPGQHGADGAQGPQGQRGAQGPSGQSIVVLDNAGSLLGHPVPWRSSAGVSESAVLMSTDNPDATFPMGWVIPENAPSDIYFVGTNCQGTPMAKPFTVAPLFSNFLYWVPSSQILYKKIGSVASSAGSSKSRATGACTNAVTAPQTFDQLDDSGFRMQFENTKPWTAAYQ